MPSSEVKHGRAARLLAPVVIVVVTLLLCEGLLRAWFNLFPPIYHGLLPASKTGLHLFEPSNGNAFYRVKPGYRQSFLRHEFRIDVRTNNIGLREERDYLGEHVDIGFIGDSYTFGWGVKAGERYSDVVADAFPGLNVLSYSYPNGHAPVNYLAFLQQNPEMLPDVLVLGLFAFNDLADDTADAEVVYRDGKIASVGSKSLEVDENGFVIGKGSHAPPFPTLEWWNRHTAIGRTIKVARQRLRSAGNKPEKPDQWRAVDAGEWDETAMLALDHVRRIDRLAQAAGSTLLVLYIPFPSVISETPVCVYSEPLCIEQRTRNALGESLSDWAAEENIRFIDPVDYFRVLTENGKNLYYEWDGHWTPEGHAAAGKLIADYLDMYGLLTQGTSGR
jgi:hypothetical protein